MDLKQLVGSLFTKHTFSVGDLVTWKPGLRNKATKSPPFVVVEVLLASIYDGEANAGSPYFREPLDMVIGFLDREGELNCLHVDSRRFRPAE